MAGHQRGRAADARASTAWPATRALVTTRDLYRHAADFFDVTRGNNVLTGTPKQACGDDYLCVAKRGYDAPTGLGTPDGIGGF